jgi:hypothetical protein
MRVTVDLFQSYNGPEQAAWISESAYPIDHQKSIGFEFDLFQRIQSERLDNPRPWGLVSWKFEHKTQVSVESFHVEAARLIDQGAECVFINPMIGSHAVCRNVWEHGEWSGHRGIISIEDFLISRKYMDSSSKLMRADTFALCNYFIATPRFWRLYIEYVHSVLSGLECESKLGTEIGMVYKSNARYARNPALGMGPFIVERLFSSFLSNSTLTAVPIAPTYDRYTHKFGVLLGAVLSKMAVLKEQTSVASVNIGGGGVWRTFVENFLKAGVVDIMVRLDDPPSGFVDYAKELAYL